ncbi:MAG: FtsH protease activity modulator HflK [Gammaproteobacteria bacterium]|nr:FtsH protease activity modulator HflK [Gammaproteobacteria bacterium]
MAWNEPGGNNRDPWGGRGGSEGPPDLDEVVRKLRDRMNRLFGGRGGGKGKGTVPSISLGFIAVLLLVVWALSGIYLIQPAERGVVLRLGTFKALTGPGPHWYMRFIESVEKVDVDNVRTVSHRAKILTRDENIIQVELAVQYQVKDAQDYLFQVRDPDYTLQEATESALREVIGGIPMDEFLSGGRGEIVRQTKELIQTILERYQTGLILTSVNLQDPQPPEEVQGAFQDAIKAQEDEVKFKNQAEAYARDIVPRARGEAARMREEAIGYKERVIAQATGETSRFLQTLKEYEKAPEVTRTRLYLETMEEVLANTSKVVMQAQDGNSLMYLPLDKLMERSPGYAQPATGGTQIRTAPEETTQDSQGRRSPLREGGVR